MSRRDIFTDIAAILHPLPLLPEPDHQDYEHTIDQREFVAEEREQAAEQMRLLADEAQVTPLLDALDDARRAKDLAEQLIRELLAYGREFVQPRPYTLGDLATAAGMSISGVRTAYGHVDVDAVTEATGVKPREWRAPDPATDGAAQA